MGQAAVPTTIEPLNLKPCLLEPLEPIEIPELKYLLDLHKLIKVEGTQATNAPQEMAEDNTETSEEEEPTPLFVTLQGLESEQIPQVDLQLVLSRF